MLTLTKKPNQVAVAPICPEVELLLCCARTHCNTATSDCIQLLLQKPIDWNHVIKIAVHHKVIPLLYQSLDNTCPEAVPHNIMTRLKQYFDSNAIRNLFLTNKLFRLLTLFEQNGIRAIPYKGPVLAASVYGNLTLRQFADLDILVHPQDKTEAGKLLVFQGYQPQSEFDWEQSFRHEDSHVNVDLHWAFTPECFPNRSVDFEDLWQRLESVSLAGQEAITLSPEDLLSVLSIQIAKDCWENRMQMSKLCDLNQLLRVDWALDWSKILERASESGSEQLLLLGLGLTNELLGTELPERIMQKIQTDIVVKLYVQQACKQLFSNTDSHRRAFGIYLSRVLVPGSSAVVVSSRSHLVRHFICFVITPTMADKSFLPLPKFLNFIYYLIRPIRLVGVLVSSEQEPTLSTFKSCTN